MSEEFSQMNGSLTISGTWQSGSTVDEWFQQPMYRRVQMVMGSCRFLGVEWWAERTEFDACITGWDHENGEATFSITSAVEITRAEWWRRAGYAVFKHLPSWAVEA